LGYRASAQQHYWIRDLCTTTTLGEKPLHNDNIGTEASAKHQYWNKGLYDNSIGTEPSVQQQIGTESYSRQQYWDRGPLHNNSIGTEGLCTTTAWGEKPAQQQQLGQ
jgi:hypothetical protein